MKEKEIFKDTFNISKLSNEEATAAYEILLAKAAVIKHRLNAISRFKHKNSKGGQEKK